MAATLKFPGRGAVTPGYFILASVTVLFLALSGAFLGMYFLGGGEGATKRAMKSGQYARIKVTDGSVEGGQAAPEQAAGTPAPDGQAPLAPDTGEAGATNALLPQEAPGETPAEAPAPTGETPAPADPTTAPTGEVAPIEGAPVEATPAEATPTEAVPGETPQAPAEPAPQTSGNPLHPEGSGSPLHPELGDDSTADASRLHILDPSKNVPIPTEMPAVSAPLNPAPNPQLVQAGKDHQLPQRSEDGEVAPWDYYGKPMTADEDVPLIAIVVTDLGLSAPFTQRALALPEFVTLSYSPYTPGLPGKIKKARSLGHEAWIDLPMEPADYPASDPGPLAVMKDLSDLDNLNRLHTILAGATGIAGVTTSEEENFSNQNAAKAVVSDLHKRGLLMLLHKKESPDPEAAGSILVVNRQLDGQTQDAGSPQQVFGELEAVAQSNGYAIGVMGNSPALLKELQTWIDTLPEKKLALQSLSAVARRATN